MTLPELRIFFGRCEQARQKGDALVVEERRVANLLLEIAEHARLGALGTKRCAAGNAIVNGARRFAAIAIVGSSAAAWPCGICRQVLREFAGLDMPVIVGEFGKGFSVRTLGELLPESFGPEELGIDIRVES